MKEKRLQVKEVFAAAGRILSPVLVYFFLSVGIELFYLALTGLLQRRYAESAAWRLFSENESLIMMLLISFPALFVLYRMFRRDELLCVTDYQSRKRFPYIRYVVLAGLGASVGFNILIQMSPLIEWFPSILGVNEELSGSSTALSLFYVALVAPVTEELLLRGLVFRRCREYLHFVPAALLSALIFGALHANMVQFIYAFLLGTVLAYLYEYYGTLLAPVLFHIAGNLLGNLSVLFIPTVPSPAGNALALGAGLLFVLLMLWACVQVRKKVRPPVRRKLQLFEDGENGPGGGVETKQ